MSFNLSSLKAVVERAANSGVDTWIGLTGGALSIPSSPVLGAIAGAVISSVAKSAVGLYYTGTPTLLKDDVKAVVKVVEDVAKDPVAKPLIAAVQSVPAVAKVEAAIAPVVAAVATAVADAPGVAPLLPPA